MPDNAQKPPPEYLRNARLAAGYSSRGSASTAVYFSPETIGRHERGEVELSPSDVIEYARGYDRYDVLIRYCTSCSVGCALGRSVADRDLPLAALRVSARLRRAAAIADELEAIADDGVVDHSERTAFDEALAFLRTLEETIGDMMLWAAANGIGKGRPAGTRRPAKESTNHPYSTSTRPVCQGR